MIKKDDARSVVPGTGGQPPEPSRAAEYEEWAWMVDEDPAFYLEEPEKRRA